MTDVTDPHLNNWFADLVAAGTDVFGATALDLSYARDVAGRVCARTDVRWGGPPQTPCYVYDPAGRPVDVWDAYDAPADACTGTCLERYAYDDNGNRIEAQTPLEAVLTADVLEGAQDRLGEYGPLQLVYTENGELLSVTDTAFSKTTTFTHDALGRQRAVELPEDGDGAWAGRWTECSSGGESIPKVVHAQRWSTTADQGAVATPPRQVLPNQLFYVTVRTVTRAMRLRPDPNTVRTVAYCLAAASERYRKLGKLVLHEFVFTSNHDHLLGTDIEGCLPDFIRDLNALLFRALNAPRGLSGTNFEKGYGLVRVLSGDKALEHAAYTLADPVAAGLVARAKEWPGLSSVDMKYGKPIRVERPEVGLWSGKAAHAARQSSRRSKRAAYACRTRLPEEAELVIERPPCLPDRTDAQVRAAVMRRLKAREREFAAERRRQGRTVLGARKASRVHYLAVPKRKPLFVRNPTFSGLVDEARRPMAAAVTAFRRAYRVASRRFREGVRDVVFPAGTWCQGSPDLIALQFGRSDPGLEGCPDGRGGSGGSEVRFGRSDPRWRAGKWGQEGFGARRRGGLR